MTILIYSFLIACIAIGVYLIVVSTKRKQFIWIALAINFFTLPLALFMSIMATDSPDNTMKDSIIAFLFVQLIPIICLIIGLYRLFRQKKIVR